MSHKLFLRPQVVVHFLAAQAPLPMLCCQILGLGGFPCSPNSSRAGSDLEPDLDSGCTRGIANAIKRRQAKRVTVIVLYQMNVQACV